LEDFKDLSQCEAYLAGPFAMSYTARDEFITRGMARENMHSDAFAFA
jgi:NAD(P)H-flavin reductase